MILKKFIKVNELSQAIGITKAGIFNLIKSGKFPAGVKIGHSRRWNVEEINQWLDSQKQAQEAIS